METQILYSSAWGAGGHTLLSIIPFFLGMQKHHFGMDIESFEVWVEFDLERAAHFDADEKPSQYFRTQFAPKPDCRVIKGSKKLSITYLSQYLPFENESPFGVYVLEPNATRGCVRFGKLLRELREIVSAVGPSISKKCDFDCSLLLKIIDEKCLELPVNDAEIAELEKMQDTYYESSQAESSLATDDQSVFQSQTLPLLIPVSRIGDDQMGSYGDNNQFWGQVVAAFSPITAAEADWQTRKRWYAVLHKFDSDGHHIGTDHQFVGTSADGEAQILEDAENILLGYVSALPKVVLGDISIRLFQLEIDGARFGMLDSSNEEFGDSVTMEPADFVFYPPWNGEYDT